MSIKYLLLAFILVGFVSGCSNKSLVVVVGNIPSIAMELRVIVRNGEQQSSDIPSYTFPAATGTYSLGLTLKNKKAGPVQITAGAFLHGCLLATGVFQIEDLATTPDDVSFNLDAMNEGTVPPSCPNDLPILLRAETQQGANSQGLILTVRGFGFTPKSEVIADHSTTLASGYVSLDPTRFSVDIGQLVPPIDHELFVETVQPDGRVGKGLFTVSIPVFNTSTPPIYPTSSSDPFLILTGLRVVDIDGKNGDDLLVSAVNLAKTENYISIYHNDGKGDFSKTTSTTIVLNRASNIKTATINSVDFISDANKKSIILSYCMKTTGLYPFPSVDCCCFDSIDILNSQIPRSRNIAYDINRCRNDMYFSVASGFKSNDLKIRGAMISNALATPFTSPIPESFRSVLEIFEVDTFNGIPKRITNLDVGGSLQHMVSGANVLNSPAEFAVVRTLSESSGSVDLYQYSNNNLELFESVLINNRPGRIAFGNFDTTGYKDIIVSSLSYGTEKMTSLVNVLTNNSGSWSVMAVNTPLASLSVAAIDLLSDKKIDIVAGYPPAGMEPAQLGLLFNQKPRAIDFATRNNTKLSLPTTNDMFMAVGDFNGDQKDDLAIATSGVATGAGARTGSLFVYFGL